MTWAQMVDTVYASTEFANLVPTICGTDPFYYFGTTKPTGMAVTGAGFQGTQAALQALLNVTAAGGGGTVDLAQRALIKITSQPLTVPAGVTLETTGRPDTNHYPQMARLVRDGPTNSFPYGDVVVVAGASGSGAGGTLRNVWVDGEGGNPSSGVTGGVVTTACGANATLSTNKLSNPGVDSSEVGLPGMSNFQCGGPPASCTNLTVDRNLVTGYSRDHFNSHWSDGITLVCEDASATANTVVDATDVGIVMFGNRYQGVGADQRSRVTNNTTLSAGNSAFAALEADPNGTCSNPCSDLTTRDFTGATFTGNTLFTGPRTAFGFGVGLGIRSLFANGPDGSGASATNNTVGASSAQANVGLGVSGMFSATLTGNTGSFRLTNVNTCPIVDSGASVSAGWASFATTPQTYTDVAISNCWGTHP